MMDDSARVTDPPDTADANAAVETDNVAVADREALLAAVTAERDQLADEKTQLHDRLLRRTAEFENFRRRVERERIELIEFAVMETIRQLLPALDDFERALKVECADKEYARGMELIYQRLSDSLKKMGLEAIAAQGQRFDPHLHHAVETVRTGEVEDHTVLEEHQRGYNFKGRLLRPAMVKVAVKP
jgi:molecular chaperone GrpE